MELEKQIEEIEAELKRTPYNKATQHHIGKLKAKLARLKDELERSALKRKATRRAGFALKKTGHATVGLIGYPNVGKSTLLNELTSAKSRVEAYGFTTLKVIPGMLEYKGAKFQLLDLPGLIEGAAKGKGRGLEILSVLRALDLIIVMIDALHQDQLGTILEELYKANVRLNAHAPNIILSKKVSGGINISSTIKLTKAHRKLIKTILQEYGYANADLVLREAVTEEQLIDFLAGNRAYVKGFGIINKIDLLDKNEKIPTEIKNLDIIGASAKYKKGIKELKEKIFTSLDFIQIYLKPPEGKIDYNKPLVIKRGSTIERACELIHRDFKKKFKYALVWGKSAKFNGQRVGLNHVLKDNDVLTIVLSR